MGRLRNLARRVAERVARRVAQDELFEKPGERAHTPPLSASEGDAEADDDEPASLGLVWAGSAAELVDAVAVGGAPLIVHHWATWCAPCEEELPVVQQLAESMVGKARVLGVSWDAFEGGAPEALVPEVEAFAQRMGLSWPTLLVRDPPEAFFEALGLAFQRIPQTSIHGADGELLLRIDGAMGEAELERVRAAIG